MQRNQNGEHIMKKIKKYWNSRSRAIKSYVVIAIVLIVIGIIL